ncbi:ROK family transcriptional regulator [Microbacterium dextranolyticum]|uniref:ROK family transcriptional regulator n=1 Tax=Microbacterium dextranolyticum TaxID=36806 RepID=UPI001D340DBD|nr:ROK family transcriptional regulator [Microbacterium dextranolyticum]MBM7461873.1 putative NBD/HSP70 family sugar kinase [Microbacterium dextranolyticum]
MRTTPPQLGSQPALREANSQRIVTAIRHHGALTQVEIAAATGLSQATVSTIVKHLVGQGVVDTRTTVRTGRRAQLVTLAQRSGLAVGVQIGSRSLRVLVGDSGYEGLSERVLPLPRDHRADTTLDRVALLIVDLLEDLGADLSDVVGVGIALPPSRSPGTERLRPVDAADEWHETDVAEVLSRRLGVPVVVEQDATAGAVGELRFGAGRGATDILYVRCSYLVNAGIVLGGRPFRGRRGLSGEVGHVEVDPSGAICTCGSRGCLNTVVGADALTDLLRISRPRITLRDLIALALEGDAGCRQVIADAGAAIGAVVAGLALALDPEKVVVGGELAQTGELLIGPLRDALSRRVPLAGVGGVDVVAGELGSESEVQGLVALAFDAAATGATASAGKEQT